MNDVPEISDGFAAAALELAERHSVEGRNPAPLPAWEQLQSVKRWLARAREICAAPPPHLVKAAEWLLDNERQIERALRQIAEDLPPSFYRRLTRLSGPEDAGIPRAYAIAHGLLRASHLQVSSAGAVRFIDAYQQRAVLTIAELWALPTMLRLACLELLLAAFERITADLHPPFVLSHLGREPLSLEPGECVARSIANLAVLSTISWKDFFDQVSRVEAILQTDPAGIYARMDFASRDHYRRAVEALAFGSRRDEPEVAEEVIARASRAGARPENLVGYWLDGEGRARLEASLGFRPKPAVRWQRALRAYPGTLYAALFATATLASLVVVLGVGLTEPPVWAIIVALIVSAVPASVVGVTVAQWILTLLVPPRLLTRLDFEGGIATDAPTAVVVPVLVTRASDTDALMERLELHRLANPDPALRFVVLSDVRDAAQETEPGDAAVVAALTAGIERHNVRYGHEGRGPFHLLHRHRRFNANEGVFMGWERKRGKLEQFNDLVATGDRSDFAVAVGDTDSLRSIRFVVTVDADTVLPPGSVARLVGTLASPINAQTYDPASGRVTAGYTIVQPRIEVAPTGRNRTLFAQIYAGDTSIDIYSRAVSNVYQDLFGEGIFAGKGIYDVAAFRRSCGGVWENTLLSHDLFEGVKGRAALASDIVLYENIPSNYIEHARRWHRWVRGDWQLLPWLFGRPSTADNWRPSGLDRWKMIDNLRRSLVAPGVVLFVAVGWLALPVNPWVWTLLAVAATGSHLLTGFFTAVAGARSISAATRGLVSEGGRWLLGLAFTANDAVVASDAIARTLWRVFVSHRHLLQWTPASEVAAALARRNRPLDTWRSMAAAPAVAIVLAGAIGLLQPAAIGAALPVLVLWLGSPQIAVWVGRPRQEAVDELDADDRIFLRRLARRTWLFFETMVGPEDNWLPPDNCMELPRREVDHRTSPTNIGLMFVSSVAAWDLGYIGALDLATRVRSGLDALDRMAKFQGHLFNWYDSRSLAALEPRYVSTVDSGNLAASLIVLREACIEALSTPVMRRERWDGLLDTLAELRSAASVLKSASVDAAIAAVAETTADVRDHPRRWRAATVSVCDVDFPALQADITAAVRADRKARPAAIQDIQVWLERVGHHLVALRRTYDLVLPWAALVEAAPAEGAHAAALVEAAIGNAALSVGGSQALAVLDGVSPETPDGCRWVADVKATIEAGMKQHAEIRDLLVSVAARAEAAAFAMDFRFLFDRELRLFHIGYNASVHRTDPNHYDLLASEARIASYFAIAKRDVPYEHWFHLARPVLRLADGLGLASWNGSMFEYLMPALFLPSLPETLLGEGERAAVDAQRRYGDNKKVPWGFSESAFAAVDGEGHFRYRAFGVPELGLRRDLSRDLVVTPYATVLALAVRPSASTRNLRAISNLGLTSRYGLIEAADFTPRRVSSGSAYAPVTIVMAHHQGMSLAAIDNALTNNGLVRRFMADPRMRSVELLLRERVPWEAPAEAARAADEAPSAPRKVPAAPAGWRPLPNVGFPQAHAMGNGSLATWISEGGGGGISWRGQALTRWAPDATRDSDGLWIYLTDRDNGAVWSATRQPTGVAADQSQVVFHPHMAEFTRRDSGIAVRLEVGVAPHDDIDIRRLSVTNEGDGPRRLRITSYAEAVLAPPRQDERHPAFSKLFVSSESVPHLNGVLFQRRPRDAREEPPAVIHRVVGDDRGVLVSAIETDRRQFLGRNGLIRRPRALDAGLSGTTGWTLDAVMALDVELDLAPGEQRQLAFLTMAAGTRQSVLDLAARYTTLPALEWTFTDAVAEAAREAQQLELPPDSIGDLQRLGSLILYPHAALRGPSRSIADNRLGQPALWGMGISGDFPIVLIRTKDAKDTGVLRALIRAHTYWRKRGLLVDLAVLRTGSSAYEEPMRERVATLLQDAEAQAQFGRRGGIHLVLEDQVGDDQVRLLESVARVVLDEGRTIAEQIAAIPPPLRPLPRFEQPPTSAAAEPPQLPVPTVTHDNGYGGFAEGGREYVMRWSEVNRPPSPWCNVLANPGFGTIVSEAGLGFTWAVNSGENRLTPWSNDTIADRQGEAIYLRDEETGQVWSPTPEPAGQGAEIEVRHGFGHTTWRRQSHALEQTLKVFVPPDEPVKVARLTLKNLSAQARRLTSTYYAEWVLGAVNSASRTTVVAGFEPGWPALIARNPWNPDFAERVAFLVSNAPVHDFTNERQEFLGQEGDVRLPRAMTRWGLGRGTRPGADSCGAYQVHIDLAPGESTEVVFVLGQGKDRVEAEALAGRWQNRHLVDAAEKATDDFWRRMVGPVTVHTPDPAFDLMVNGWLLYQSASSRFFARAGFQQASGAFGFRDQLQDVLALMWSNPALARAHILSCAAHQFEEGDVLHWWHPPGGQGVRTRCSDDLLWLPYVVAAYASATGDIAILDEELPFLSAPTLNPDEHDRYARFTASSERGTLLQHCERALQRGVTRGPNGLPLIGDGDWNDGMNRVGHKGRGESVWLAWFAIATVDAFVDLCRRVNHDDLVERWRGRAAELRTAVENVAWDGEWYMRAFDDDGRPWGSKTAEECQIDSIAQSWSVLARGSSPARAKTAIESAWHRLEQADGVVRLLWPPFTDTARDPGYIKAYPPGVRENGGQYAHAAAWLGLAFAATGDGDAAARVFDRVNPILRARTHADADRYRVEPYVLAADVAGAEPKIGLGGWTWYTGSAAWTWRLAVEGMLGLRLRDGMLTIAPFLPRSWRTCQADVRGPGGSIRVRIEDPDGSQSGPAEWTVDGQRTSAGPIAFPTDGTVRQVVVRLGRPSAWES